MSALQIEMLNHAEEKLKEAVSEIETLINEGSIDALLPPVNSMLLKTDLWCRQSFLESLVHMCELRS